MIRVLCSGGGTAVYMCDGSMIYDADWPACIPQHSHGTLEFYQPKKVLT